MRMKSRGQQKWGHYGRVLIPWLVCWFVVSVVFLPILGNGFVGEDQFLFVENVFYDSLGNIAALFDSDAYYEGTLETSYRPLMSALLVLLRPVLGLEAFSWHLLALLIHGGVAAVLFRVLAFFEKDVLVRCLGVGCFALNSLVLEVLSVVSYWEDLFCSLFLLLSLLMLLKFQDGRKRSCLLFGALLALMAMLCKELGLVVLALAPVLMFVRNKSSDPSKSSDSFAGPGGWLWPLTGALLPTAGIYIAARFFLVLPSFLPPEIERSFAAVVAGLLIPARYYLQRLFQLPEWTGIQFASITDFSGADIAVAAGVVLVCAAVAVALSRKSWMMALGIFWVAIAMAPTSNIVPLFRPLGERFTYLALAGLSFWIVGLIGKHRSVRVQVGVALFLIYSVVLSFSYTFRFRSNLTYSSKEQACWQPNEQIAMQVLGYLESGETRRALSRALENLSSNHATRTIWDYDVAARAALAAGEYEAAAHYSRFAVESCPEGFPFCHIPLLTYARILHCAGNDKESAEIRALALESNRYSGWPEPVDCP